VQPDVPQDKTQQSVTEAARFTGRKQFSSCCFQELSILDTRWTYLLAGTATQAAIDMALESGRIALEPAFTDRSHQIKAAARSVVFIAGDNVGRTRLQTQPTVNAGEQLLFFGGERGSEL
jgi:hypothetical protein